MKKFILFALISLFSTPALYAAEVTANSTITKVTVYQDRALVTRRADVKLEKGHNAILFENLPSALIEESLRADGKSAVPVTLFGAELKKTFTPGEVNPRVAKITEELEKLRDDASALEKEREDLAAQRNFLNNISNFSSVQIPKEIMTKSSAPSEWTGIAQYLLDAYTENNKKLLANDQAVRALNKEIEAKQRELDEINSGRNIERKNAVVNVEAREAGTFQIELSYLVPQASWSISYDAKVYPDKKEAQLISYGNVRQWTGEDWNNVSVTLSSAKPAIGGRIPELYPWYVDFYRPIPMASGGVVAQRKALGEMTLMKEEQSVAYDMADSYAAASAPMEMAQAEISQELGSVTYEIPSTMTVLSDNQLYKSSIMTDSFKVEIDYETTPKLSPYVFIHSKVINDKDYSIAGGDLNVFMDDNYIARSYIPTIGRGEKFDLYLGIDEEIKVKRTELKDKRKKALLGLRTRRDYGYKIELENYKTEKVKILVNDQLPVSKNADIKTELSSSSEKPSEKNEKKELGILQWEFELDPKEKKSFEFTFFVEYPADKNVSGV